mmetsp:Transcript_30352/g.46453  ORF Transcript_30352/g.46453 Transcript_30352/m.46453 type:complete len:81 (-) Transcript_30352:456-698(-)
MTQFLNTSLFDNSKNGSQKNFHMRKNTFAGPFGGTPDIFSNNISSRNKFNMSQSLLANHPVDDSYIQMEVGGGLADQAKL